jgi:hypothetical protein
VPKVLTARALNRALLARQGLLQRAAVPPLEMVEQLVGMQAQVPENPYVALHARLSTFDPRTLSAAIEADEAVRAQLMRATIHLVTRRDLAAIAPITADVLARTFKSQFSRRLPGVTGEEVAAAGQALLASEPRTRAELATHLQARWPDADPAVLAQAVTYLSPLIQVPPRARSPTSAAPSCWTSPARRCPIPPRPRRRASSRSTTTSASATSIAPGSSAAAGRACRFRVGAGSGRCSSTASTGRTGATTTAR